MYRAVSAIMAFCLLAAPAARAQDSDAGRELDAAIRLLRQHHLNRDKLDWADVTAQAEARLIGNKAADAYSAIRFVIAALGVRHSFLLDADAAEARRTGRQVGNAVPPPLVLPAGRLIGTDVGVVALQAMADPHPEAMQAYAGAAQGALARLAQARVCRTIVDLRGNGGGNMYPMIQGLAPLLGAEPYGYFIPPSGEPQPWAIATALTRQGVGGIYDPGPRWQMRAPVAVLIDRHTASSGEFTAMAFEGRANTRFFGENSAGFTTANASFALPDGAQLVVTESYGADRNMLRYDDTIAPDTPTPPGDETLAAAVKWLRAQPCETK